jgi:hypothetical protein
MRRLALLAIATAAAVACVDRTTAPNVVTQYNLLTLNGQPLPYLVTQVGDVSTTEIAAGRIEFRADDTFFDATTYRVTKGPVLGDTEQWIEGAFEVRNDTIVFLLQSADSSSTSDEYSGVIQDNFLTITVGTTVWKYTKK